MEGKRRKIEEMKKKRKCNRFMPDADPDEDKREELLDSQIQKKYCSVFDENKDSDNLKIEYPGQVQQDFIKKKRQSQYLKMMPFPLLQDLAFKNDQKLHLDQKLLDNQTVKSVDQETTSREETSRLRVDAM